MTSTLHQARRARIEALGYDYASKPKTDVHQCNLCGEGCFVTVAHHDRYGFPARAQACHCCGLTFLNPVMTSDSYVTFYENIYRPLVSAYHGRLIDATTIQEEQHDYAVRLATELGPYLTRLQGGALLDIGGSTGVIAHHLKRAFGLRATVIDPAPMEVEVARRLELEAITGFIEDFEPAERNYQLVLMCQTIDHLLDVKSSLRKVRQVMADEGIFYVDIVDFRAAYRRNSSVEESIKIDHPYYLTEPLMEALLRRTGFAIQGVDYAADHLHVGFICSKSEPDLSALPRTDDVRDFFREVRAIHNPVPAL
jgi:ubiquinone/menaquinone biosynthesis C-methylase UbiE